jgi:type I site-specific restriction endonuclease
MEILSKKVSEAEVESRIVIPLLANDEYLAIPKSSIRDKKYLYPRQLDKAAGKTGGYYPDFSVWEESFPLVIIEAKARSVDVSVGYREASLYALHLNRLYRTDINPCEYIVATNGERLLAGFWNANPEIDVSLNDIAPGTEVFERLRERIGRDALKQRAMGLRQQIAREGFFSATRGAQTSALINTKVPPNRFASALIQSVTVAAEAWARRSRQHVDGPTNGEDVDPN